MQIQGHRGARGLVPENTLPSFERALDLEVDVLELDLHLSKDGQPVIWHDAHVRASKCESGSSGIVPAPTKQGTPESAIRGIEAASLRKLSCHLNPDPTRFPDQRPVEGDYGVVSLDELFAFVSAYATDPTKSASQRANAATVEFNIETKRKPDQPEFIGDAFDGANPGLFERAVIGSIKTHGLESRVVLQSFDHRSIWAASTLSSTIRLAALEKETGNLEELANKGAHIWSPRHTLVTPATLKRAHAAGLLVIPWTINDRVRMDELVAMGVDGIITDRPDLAP